MNNKKVLVCATLVIFGTALLLMQSLGQNAQAVIVKKTIVSKQIDLPAGKGIYFPFSIPQGASEVYLSGKTKVVGGIISQVYIGLYYTKNCPAIGATVNFAKCRPIPIISGFYGNDNSFGLDIPSGQKYYILFQNFTPLGEEKIIKPIVTVSYNN